MRHITRKGEGEGDKDVTLSILVDGESGVDYAISRRRLAIRRALQRDHQLVGHPLCPTRRYAFSWPASPRLREDRQQDLREDGERYYLSSAKRTAGATVKGRVSSASSSVPETCGWDMLIHQSVHQPTRDHAEHRETLQARKLLI